MEINLKGKRVLITSSTKGIGKELAKVFLKEGCKVVITSRNKQNVNLALEELRQISSNDVFGLTSDLTDYNSLSKLVNDTINLLGGIDVLVVNSGNTPKEPSTMLENSIEDWEHATRLFLLGPVYLSTLVSKYMIEQKWGRIIFISSWTIKEPQDFFSLADVTRASLIQFTKLLARELGKYGITVNVLLLGSFPTETSIKTLHKIAQKLGMHFDELWNKYVIDVSAVKRVGNVEKDLGPLVIYLSSEYSSYVTGSYFLIDGGTTRAI
ncbi:MAG: SDR family NAD(P)-dependent oxidoreductase [Sulfolobus sp.]|nr:SDR family NAD(P)-dependent oxidoreductase [Sulfolobus sp.]